MTNAPSDLLTFRGTVMRLTGIGSAVEVGIVGDGAHQRTGGYHEGMDVLLSIGEYHAPPTAHIGSSTEDYSVRTARDRRGLTDSASAMDIGDDWPQGGRPAWLRFNNLLVSALRSNDPALSAVRATNYSPDGTSKRRTDREHGWAIESSTDSVDVHTHIEWYRDTEGHRQSSLDRLADLITQAITGGEPTVTSPLSANEHIWLGNAYQALLDPAFTVAGKKVPGTDRDAVDKIAAIRAQLSALTSKIDALTTAVSELAAKVDAQRPAADIPLTLTLTGGGTGTARIGPSA